METAHLAPLADKAAAYFANPGGEGDFFAYSPGRIPNRAKPGLARTRPPPPLFRPGIP